MKLPQEVYDIIISQTDYNTAVMLLNRFTIGRRYKDKIWGDAIETGNIFLVKWLHENRIEGCTTRAMDWSDMKGHLLIVKFLNENLN